MVIGLTPHWEFSDLFLIFYGDKLNSCLQLAVAGVITTFAVDPCHSWLTVGTSSGMIVCWDLRFQLPITNLSSKR